MSLVGTDPIILEAQSLKAVAEEYVAAQRRIDKLVGNPAVKEEPLKSELSTLQKKADRLESDANKYLQLHSQYHAKLKTEQKWDGQRYIAIAEPCPLCPSK